MRTFVFCAAIVMAGVVGCSKTGSPSPEQKSDTANVPIDLGTPDKALKSYWAVRDSVRKKQFEVYAQNKDAFLLAEAQMSAVAEGALAKTFSNSAVMAPETFSRDIIDVKVESESRAVIVVVIKNTTPIPAGAEVSKFDEGYRRDGERYRYVLEKSQAGWRVAEIWEWSTYPSKDWKKIRPDDGKPYVPSLAFNGV